MFSKLERVPSKAMGEKMFLWRFGHYGQPLLVFPSSAGMAHEWEFNGLIGVLEPTIRAGKLKLYCTESNVTEAWFSDLPPEKRIKRHMAFEKYVVDELVPHILEDCETPDIPIWIAGTSLGGYYSANLLLKHPGLFSYALCLSGRYDARILTDGFDNLDVYYCNPMAFVPNLHGEQLESARQNVHLDLVVGQGDHEGRNIEQTKQFASILASKGISHRCELWGDDVTHEWTWWNRQALFYLSQRVA
ncbi:MAG: esterase [bacterium]|nr:esterase [bacterium]